MTDFSNSRQILPATVSSTAAAGPVTPSKARVSFACEACKRRKCKCTGGPPCESCLHANIQCVFDETQDKRRKVHSKRALEDLVSTNESLVFHVKVFRGLQRAIQSDTHQEAFEQIRQHSSLREIALALGDNIPEAEEEGLSVDIAQSLLEGEAVDTSPGPRILQGRVIVPTDDAMDVQLRGESSNSDVMELDPPATNALIGSELRWMQHERNHYKRIVTQMQHGTGAEAEEAFRSLRALAQRNTLQDSLPIRGEGLSTFGGLRTLPEISTSIRTLRTSWFERGGSGTGPLLSATSSHATPKSRTSASSSGPEAGVPPPLQPGSAMGLTGLSQYISSHQRLRRESGTYVDKERMRSK